MLAGVARLAVMVPGSAFLETPADEPLEFPGLGPALILWTFGAICKSMSQPTFSFCNFSCFRRKSCPLSGGVLPAWSVGYCTGWRRSVTLLICLEGVRTLSIPLEDLTHEFKAGQLR